MAKAPKQDPMDMEERHVNQVDTGKMDAKIKQEDEAAFLDRVRKNAAHAHAAWSENFKMARHDLRFLAGDQWPDYARAERVKDNRPMLTFNDFDQYVSQVTNDQRQNRPSINIIPGDDGGAETEVESAKGGSKYKMSEVFQGIIRHIESQSQADSHYDTAHQHSVEAGFGWLRVNTCYAKPTSFDLDARIGSVRNRMAVLIDPDFEEPDASDTNFGFVFEEMLRTTFDQLYPDAAVGDLSEFGQLWGTEDKVVVAEYFERYAVKRTLLQLSSGEITWKDKVEDVLDELAERGTTIVRQREVDTYAIRWFKLTANSILRGPTVMPCTTIPLIPVFGKELNIDGRSDYRGLIRNAKDAKMADNFWMTSATERVALAPNAPWVVEQEQIEGLEKHWQNANRGNPAYLPYKRSPSGTVPQRNMGSGIPIAELEMSLRMNDRVKSTIGMYNASVGAQSNETSGKAILARQHEADVSSFTYIDNLSRAIRRVGLILVEMIPELYTDQRVARILKKDDTVDHVVLNQVVKDEETGEDVVINDLSRASFDVVVKTGPAYSTLRQEAAEALMEFIRVAPAIGTLVFDKIASAMDWPGADEIRMRMLRQLPPHLLTEQEREEIGEMPQPEPTPEQQADMAKSEADIEMARAKMAEAEARSQEAQAQMAEIASKSVENEQMAELKRFIEETMVEVLAAAANVPASEES